MNFSMEYDIRRNIHDVSDSLRPGVELVAVSKYHPDEHIKAAYMEGQRVFGESHERELTEKYRTLPKDIRWHFIGHLQTNKVKYIVPYISMIDSVDSFKLLKEIDRQAAKYERIIDVLLEIRVAQEETKYGFLPDECRRMLDAGQWRELDHVRICGLMTMASNVDDENQIRSELEQAAALFDEIKQQYFADNEAFRERSWGMSDDYHIAMDCRSTMVRVGSKIFGPRI